VRSSSRDFVGGQLDRQVLGQACTRQKAREERQKEARERRDAKSLPRKKAAKGKKEREENRTDVT